MEYPDRFVVPDGMSVWDYLHTSYHRALQEMFPREASGAALVQGVSSIPRSAPKLLASRDVSVSPYHWCKWRFRSNLIFRQAPDGITEVYSTRIVLHTLDRYRKDCGRPECRLVVTATDAVAYWRHYAANRALAGLNPWVACPPWFVAASRADGWAPPGCVWPPL